ncbi:MAG: hypothetical protein ACPGLY_27990 [Rubripirellula sp.]
MKSLISNLIVLAVSANCFAQVETKEVTAKRGKICVLECEEQGKIKWFAFYPYDLEYKTFENNRVFAFVPPVGESKAVVEYDCIQVDEKGDVTRPGIKFIVTFEGDPPKPPSPPAPDPDDPPGPRPDVPEGYLGLTKLIASQRVPKAHRRLALQFASAFEDVGNGLSPGDAQQDPMYTTAKAAMEDLQKMNNDIMKTDEQREAWLPVLQAYDARIREGLPPTKHHIADAMRAAAKGFGYLK